jgi:hypothetical protein
VPPNTYQVEIPTGWEVTSPKSGFKASIEFEMADAAGVPKPINQGIPTEAVPLEKLPAGTDGKGVTLRARYAQVVSGSPLKAEHGVGFYSIGESNDPGSMLQSLAGGDEEHLVVELPAGPALRRTYEHKGSAVRQFLVPVPNTKSDIALLSYATPTVDRRDELLELFDSMARGFAFDWETGANMPEIEDWLRQMANESGQPVTYVTDSGEERTVSPGPAKPGVSFEMSGSPFAGGITPLGLPPPQSRAVGLLLLLFLLAVVFTPSITLFAKAPILILGAVTSLSIARSRAGKGWTVIAYVAALLGGIYFTALAVYGDVL